jgi:deoxyhypusine synthase
VRRIASVVAGIAATVLLTSCGTQTITASETGAGVAVSFVITGDTDAVNTLEATIRSAGLTIAGGSSPKGAHVCGFNRSKNGHAYQVDVYGDAPTTTCSLAAQTEFLAEAP